MATDPAQAFGWTLSLCALAHVKNAQDRSRRRVLQQSGTTLQRNPGIVNFAQCILELALVRPVLPRGPRTQSGIERFI